MQRSSIWMMFASALLACGGNGSTTPDARIPVDAVQLNRIERAYLISDMVIPTTMEEVDMTKFEYPGTGVPVNKMGSLTRVLLTMLEGVPVQEDLTANYANGMGLQAIVLNGPEDLSLNDDGISARFVPVVDADDPADPSNDHSGTGEFVVAPGESFVPAYSSGTWSNGELVMEGTPDVTITIAMPFFAGETPVMVPGVMARVRGTADENGFQGAAGSLITVEQVHASVYPLSARLLTTAITMDLPTKDAIKSLFDLDDNDEVTVQELIDNSTMATLTQPDVDIDDDGVFDYLSQATFITTVRVADLVE